MKYIITWIMYVWTATECPDKHGSYNGYESTCAVAHFIGERVKKDTIITGWNNAVNFADSLKRKLGRDNWPHYPSYDSIDIKPFVGLKNFIPNTPIGFSALGTSTGSASVPIGYMEDTSCKCDLRWVVDGYATGRDSSGRFIRIRIK